MAGIEKPQFGPQCSETTTTSPDLFFAWIDRATVSTLLLDTSSSMLTPERPAAACQAAGTPLLSMPNAYTSTRPPPASSSVAGLDASAASRPAPAVRISAAESV